MAIIIGVGGWFVYDVFEATEDELEKARARITQLEERVQITDEAVTETGASASEQINLWESEIRRLEQQRKRNKSAIEENQAAFERRTKTVSAIETSMRGLKAQVSRHEGSFSQQQEVIDQLNTLQENIEQLFNQQRDLVDKVNVTSVTTSGLRSNLETRVKENEEAITAIDAHRREVNARLADLKRRLELSTH
jgi:chromosome segregation ATPase